MQIPATLCLWSRAVAARVPPLRRQMGCAQSGRGALGCAGNPDCSTDAGDRRRRRPQPTPFRTASLRDDSELDQWFDLLAEVFAGKTTREYFELHWAADPRGSGSRDLANVFVAWAGATIVGSVRLYLRTITLAGSDVHCAGVGEVATRSSHRNQGVASSLLGLAGESMSARALGVSVLHTSSSPWLYQKHNWVAVHATSLLLPVGTECGNPISAIASGKQHWTTAPLDIESYGNSYELLHPLYASMSASFDGTAVRDAEYWSSWLASEAKRRGARGWTLTDQAGTLLGYALFTAASWERRDGQLPPTTPKAELQLVDFGCRDTAEPEVHRILEKLGAAAAQAGPECEAVCVVPAPLLPERARGKDVALRVDTGWFYRVEGTPEGVRNRARLTVAGSPVDASKHVVWTLDKF